jgi:hypothetical protein
MGIINLVIKLLSNRVSLIILLLVGIVIGVYLVQNTQIFNSRASSNVADAFEIKDANGNLIQCNGNTCYTETDRVDIRLKNVSVLE